MDQGVDRSAIRDWTLRARRLLVGEDGHLAAAAAPRRRADAALTQLLRLAAIKMLHARGLLDGPIDRCLADQRPGQIDRLVGGDGSRGFRDLSPARLTELIESLEAPALGAAWLPGNEEALGWIHQYFREPDIEVYRGTRSPKVPADEVPAKTQLFTPRWIVEFLVHNTLGRLWCQMHRGSTLGDRLAYLVPGVDANNLSQNRCGTGFQPVDLWSFGTGPNPAAPLKSVRELTVLDPACGAMHFGLVVFDLLVEMYREELARAGQHGWPEAPPVRAEREIPAAILAHNLFGIDIDAQALQVAQLALWLRATLLDPRLEPPRMNVSCEDALFPDAARGERRYDVVVTNPPYLDTRDYDAPMKSLIHASYPASKRNVYAAFIERSVGLLRDGGRLGIITPQTFMFISSFRELRAVLRRGVAIETLVQAGLGTFPDAVVDAAFYVLRREPDEDRRKDAAGIYLRLVKGRDSDAKRRACQRALAELRAGGTSPVVHRYRQGDFDALPGEPWVYWITPRLRDLFRTLPRLKDVARPIVGLQTSDNFRFLRYWWEVFTLPPDASPSRVEDHATIAFGCRDIADALASGRNWFPHIKGGGYRRWHGNQEYVVNWAHDGAEIKSLGIETGKVASRPQNTAFYFRPGVTWTHTSSRGLSVRVLPPGFICNVEGMAAFPKGGVGSPLETLAILNSAFARHVIDLLNPTVHFGGREVGDLPYPAADKSAIARLEQLVAEAIQLARADSAEDQTTFDFVAPPAWETGLADIARRQARLSDIERHIDDEVYALYGIDADDRKAIETDLVCTQVGEEQPPSARADLAAQWISYAVGVVLGRFRVGDEGALGRGRFAADVARALRATAITGGIAPLDSEHEDDLARAVLRALEAALGPGAAAEVVCSVLGESAEPAVLLRRYLQGPFFKRHLRQYRQRPVYWLLQSPERRYGLYVYHENMSRETLERIRGDRYLGRKLSAENLPSSLRADLEAFDRALQRVLEARNERNQAVGWQREIDDGVLINLAPLRELVPAWRAELARCWGRLEAGDYDWSGTARRYWPDRALDKCQHIKSIALAHDRLDVYAGNC